MFEKLIYLRQSKDFTQQEMANIIGVERSMISKWERNREPIPLKHLNTYSNYFGVSLDYLVGLTQIRSYNSEIKDLNLEIIGSRIFEFRRNENLTLRNLASELHTTSSTISAYEKGKVLILTSFAYQICMKYNISLDWLCGKIN